MALFPAPTPVGGTEPDIRVGFILSPRFSLLPLASFLDSLRHAADEGDFGRQVYCQWKIIGPSTDPVSASCGAQICPESHFPDPTRFDYVVVVGGQLPHCLEHPERTLAYLRDAYRSNTSVVGLCTGSFVLGKAGLLQGRTCAVHFEHRNQLEHLFPDTTPDTDQIYVNDNEVITCAGGTAALDLAFTLIERKCGKSRAIKGLTSLLVERHRSPSHMPHRAYGHLLVCGNPVVEKAVELMERYFSNRKSIEWIAEKLGTSERELTRAFKRHAGEPPASVWRNMCLSHGHFLILNTSRSVTQVAMECGFSDSAHFCRWFKRVYNESPMALRNRHRNALPHN